MAVETTPGASDADAYVDPDTVQAYAVNYGRAWTPTLNVAADAACRAATQWLDATYRNRFPGSIANSGQALEWPRKDVWYRGAEMADDAIPQIILDACCEAACRELTEPGSLAPDLERGGAIRRIQAGSVAIEYGGNAAATTTFQIVDRILAGLLCPASSPYTAKAARG